MPILSKEENRKRIEEVLRRHRAELGEEKFQKLVDEISEVEWEYLVKLDSYLWKGGLDGYVQEKRQLEKENVMKWLLIKQKYGLL